jgi:ADP-heptose:LPS heptosyltransferase
MLGRHAVATFGNDTGPMHLIAPTGCPCWVLFSSHSDPARHAPIGENIYSVQWDDLGPMPAQELLSEAAVKLIRSYADGTKRQVGN